jgi:hypothetical protein
VVLPTLPSPTIISFTVENTLLSCSSSRKNLKIARGVAAISLGTYRKHNVKTEPIQATKYMHLRHYFEQRK